MQLSAEWLIKNMPELTGLKFAMTAAGCMSRCAAAAAEAVGRGMGSVVLSVKGWHNVPGRYGQRGANSRDTVSGPRKYGTALAGPPVYGTAVQFERYLHKYGKTHDMMTPFVVNSRSNGLKFPEGYWYQHRPTPLTAEEYRESRWVAEPANLYDNDIPIHTAAAYLFTTADRARDMRQPPAYVLGHAGAEFQAARHRRHAGRRPRQWAAAVARRVYESAGVSAADFEFENAYDGFSLFHVFWVEGFGYAGVKEGEALDFFASQDISINGPTPVSPSGGNIGSGRTRFWMWTDTIQQLQGRAGDRQVKKDVHSGFLAAAPWSGTICSPYSVKTRCNRQPAFAGQGPGCGIVGAVPAHRIPAVRNGAQSVAGSPATSLLSDQPLPYPPGRVPLLARHVAIRQRPRIMIAAYGPIAAWAASAYSSAVAGPRWPVPARSPVHIWRTASSRMGDGSPGLRVATSVWLL